MRTTLAGFAVSLPLASKYRNTSPSGLGASGPMTGTSDPSASRRASTGSPYGEQAVGEDLEGADRRAEVDGRLADGGREGAVRDDEGGAAAAPARVARAGIDLLDAGDSPVVVGPGDLRALDEVEELLRSVVQEGLGPMRSHDDPLAGRIQVADEPGRAVRAERERLGLDHREVAVGRADLAQLALEHVERGADVLLRGHG